MSFFNLYFYYILYRLKINVDKLGNGTLSQPDLFNVLQECCKENHLLLEEEQLDGLTQILWEDAVGNKTTMSLQDLKDEVIKHQGLAKGLCVR